MRNKAYSIILCLILAFLSGCQNHNEQLYQFYTNDPDNMLRNASIHVTEPPVIEEQGAIDETQGELTIYAPYSDNAYDWTIRAFNKRYPNIRVTVNAFEEDFSTTSDLAAKISVDLMSGSAGDIIDLRGMPYVQYGKNKLLEDLYLYMESDPEFHKEDYYSNIFEAIEYKSKLYAVPLSFCYECVRFNKAILGKSNIEAPEGDSIDYKGILDIYHRAAPSNDKLILSRYWNFLILDTYESIGYLDDKQDRADYNSQGYIEFLNETKKIRWPSEEEIILALKDYIGVDYYGGPYENDLCYFVYAIYQEKRNAKLFYDSPNLTIPIPMTATNGDKGFQPIDELYGILSSSKNKELAWKFIRFCIEEKSVEFLMNNYECLLGAVPINRNNAIKMLEAAFGEGRKDAVQIVDRWNSERNKENDLITTGVLLDENYKILDEFYAGRITAQECARQIQERVDIYLKE